MKRKYRRHSAFKLKLKKETVYTIFSILLFGLAGLMGLAVLKKEPPLATLYLMGVKNFGWGIIFLPFILSFFGFFFTRLKLPFGQPNVIIGSTLLWLSLITLTRAGVLGQEVWFNMATLLTSFGAFIILLGATLIGIVVFLNTSIDQVFSILTQIIKEFQAVFKKTFFSSPFPKKSKLVFPTEKSDLKGKTADVKQAVKSPPPSATAGSELGTTVIANTQNKEIWEYPPLSLLSAGPGKKAERGDLRQNAAIIERTLGSFGIEARVVEVNLGPAVTQYALEIALGTKLSKITSLSNDLALALAAPTGQIRIDAPIPGRSLVGIEIPNRSLEFVTLKTMLSSEIMQNSKSKLVTALGLDVAGNPVTADIAKMPHLLVAGTTGSGKSVLLNSFIASLLFRATPSEVKLILVDPKRVELTMYNNIPHLLTPVIVEAEKILSALKWAMAEMDRRYKLFASVNVRNIDGYNELSGFQALPYIVILIDELADLMAFAPVEVEDAICRIAQMARATGIHLIIATQRPSVDVITGLIKANIPARIAFNVSSMIDSRVILDMPGAEKLLGRGDMLYIPPDQAKPARIQGTYVSEGEIQRMVEFLKAKGLPMEYTEEVTSMPLAWRGKGGGRGSDEGKDDLFEEAVRAVCQYDRASASLLQRRLSVGYARAARIIDQLENAGIIGPGEGSKPRDVLIHNAEEFLLQKQDEQTE
ncbi:DNA translocase FtsK [Candidatus Microgenomates bacterium]|nr:DNA translocase FtsK [Candidatus Microgenomates bacterium]